MRTNKPNTLISIADYAERIGMDKELLTSQSFKEYESIARQTYWYYLRLNNYKYREIAEMFNRKSLSSIIERVANISGLIKTNHPMAINYLKALGVELGN